MDSKKQEEMWECGAYLVNLLNELEGKEKRELLKANVGAILSMTKVSEEERFKILEEIKQELIKKKIEKNTNLNYIG